MRGSMHIHKLSIQSFLNFKNILNKYNYEKKHTLFSILCLSRQLHTRDARHTDTKFPSVRERSINLMLCGASH